MQETAVAICKRFQTQLRKNMQKGVVYCRSKRQCKELAEALGCVNHHAGVFDWAERLQEWAQRDGIVVATSTLGTVVNFGDILYILHVGMPWRMVGYA
jgi:superfamily II DNA helicase RecQ